MTQVMQVNFEERLKWYGKKSGPHELAHGDFLEEVFREKIKDADVIFVNNFAFGTQLNQALKERFVDCKEGAKIVSSLNFSPLSFTITNRNLTDIGVRATRRLLVGSQAFASWIRLPHSYRSYRASFFSHHTPPAPDPPTPTPPRLFSA